MVTGSGYLKIVLHFVRLGCPDAKRIVKKYNEVTCSDYCANILLNIALFIQSLCCLYLPVYECLWVCIKDISYFLLPLGCIPVS